MPDQFPSYKRCPKEDWQTRSAGEWKKTINFLGIDKYAGKHDKRGNSRISLFRSFEEVTHAGLGVGDFDVFGIFSENRHDDVGIGLIPVVLYFWRWHLKIIC